MRRIIFIIVMLLGIGIISCGIFMQIDLTSDSSIKENNNIEKENQKDEQTKEDNLTRINKFNLKTTCQNFEETTTYINTSNFEKITFTYPNCIKEYILSYWRKNLTNEDDSIQLDVAIERNKINNYMNEKRTNIIALKNENNYDIEYSEIKKIKTKDGKNVSILEANYKTEFLHVVYTYNLVYIAVELEEEKILTFEYETNDNVISTEAIYTLIDNIKIDEDKAIFHDAINEGNYQVGTIKANKNKSYEHGYIVKYKVPKEYPATPALTSNINTVIFQYEELTKNLYVSMSIEAAIYLENIKAEIKQADKISTQTYAENKTSHRNFKTTGIIEKELNNKKVYYYIYTYDYYLNDKKIDTRYFATLLYELEPQMYVKLYMSTQEIKIDEKLISEYLNFTVEEY